MMPGFLKKRWAVFSVIGLIVSTTILAPLQPVFAQVINPNNIVTDVTGNPATSSSGNPTLDFFGKYNEPASSNYTVYPFFHIRPGSATTVTTSIKTFSAADKVVPATWPTGPLTAPGDFAAQDVELAYGIMYAWRACVATDLQDLEGSGVCDTDFKVLNPISDPGTSGGIQGQQNWDEIIDPGNRLEMSFVFQPGIDMTPGAGSTPQAFTNSYNFYPSDLPLLLDLNEYVTGDLSLALTPGVSGNPGHTTIKVDVDITPQTLFTADGKTYKVPGAGVDVTNKKIFKDSYGVWTSVYDGSKAGASNALGPSGDAFQDTNLEGIYLILSPGTETASAFEASNDTKIIGSLGTESLGLIGLLAAEIFGTKTTLYTNNGFGPITRQRIEDWLNTNNLPTNLSAYEFEIAAGSSTDTMPLALAGIGSFPSGVEVIPLGQYIRQQIFDQLSTYDAGSQFLDGISFSLELGNLDYDSTTDGKLYGNIVILEDGQDDQAYSPLFEITLADQETDLDKNYTGNVVTVTNTSQGVGSGFPTEYNCLTWNEGLNILDCIVLFSQEALERPSFWFLSVSGSFFDTMIATSISSVMYKEAAGFVEDGWKVIRDIVNILFIAALLYAAVAITLNVPKFNAKRTIATIIVIALVINFSLFLTRIIIDAGNITARLFYNEITITGKVDAPVIDDTSLGFKQKPLSNGIAGALNLQNISSSPTAYTILQKSGFAKTGHLAVILFGTVINVMTAWILFIIGFVMLTRIAMLWFAMLFSALAFASNMIPALASAGYVGWKKWLPELISQSFLATIFLFFLYVIFQLISKSNFDQLFTISTDLTLLQFLAALTVQFGIIFILLYVAKKITVSLSGELGKAVTSRVEKTVKTTFKLAGTAAAVAATAGVGAAAGAGAMAARSTIGKGAARMANSQKLINRTKQRGLSGWIAKQQLRAADATSRSSFDPRNTLVGKWANKRVGKIGGNLDAPIFSKTRLSTGAGRGGVLAEEERAQKRQQERDKRLYTTNLSDEEVKQQSTDSQQAYDNQRTAAMERAQRKEGRVFTDEEKELFFAEYALKHGPRPEVYETQTEANEANLRAREAQVREGGSIRTLADLNAVKAILNNKDQYRQEAKNEFRDKKSEYEAEKTRAAAEAEREHTTAYASEKASAKEAAQAEARRTYSGFDESAWEAQYNRDHGDGGFDRSSWENEYEENTPPPTLVDTYKGVLEKHKKELAKEEEKDMRGITTLLGGASAGSATGSLGVGLGTAAVIAGKSDFERSVREGVAKGLSGEADQLTRINEQLKDMRKLEERALEKSGMPTTTPDGPQKRTAVMQYLSTLEAEKEKQESRRASARERGDMKSATQAAIQIAKYTSQIKKLQNYDKEKEALTERLKRFTKGGDSSDNKKK